MDFDLVIKRELCPGLHANGYAPLPRGAEPAGEALSEPCGD
jgi:hypothetical protein